VPHMPGGDDDKVQKKLRKLRRLPENRICPNCLKEESLGFSSVCMKFKTFICGECKSAHQSFSHPTKSINMSFWSEEEVNSLEEKHGGGNRAASMTWLANVPDNERPVKDSPLDVYKRFVQQAYIEGRWCAAHNTNQPLQPDVQEGPHGQESSRSKHSSEQNLHDQGSERTSAGSNGRRRRRHRKQDYDQGPLGAEINDGWGRLSSCDPQGVGTSSTSAGSPESRGLSNDGRSWEEAFDWEQRPCAANENILGMQPYSGQAQINPQQHNQQATNESMPDMQLYSGQTNPQHYNQQATNWNTIGVPHYSGQAQTNLHYSQQARPSECLVPGYSSHMEVMHGQQSSTHSSSEHGQEYHLSPTSDPSAHGGRWRSLVDDKIACTNQSCESQCHQPCTADHRKQWQFTSSCGGYILHASNPWAQDILRQKGVHVPSPTPWFGSLPHA